MIFCFKLRYAHVSYSKHTCCDVFFSFWRDKLKSGVNSQYSLFFLHQRQNNDKQHLENFTTLPFYLGKLSNEQAGDRLLDIAGQPPKYFKNLQLEKYLTLSPHSHSILIFCRASHPAPDFTIGTYSQKHILFVSCNLLEWF